MVSKDKTNLGRIVGASTHKIRGIKKIITFRGGRVPESFQRSPFSVVAALVPPAQQMAKRSRPCTEEASKYTGASSQSKPEGKRVLALGAVRHRKSSPLITVQEKTQSDVKGQENPDQASGDRVHFPCSAGNPEVTERGTSDKERVAECIVVIWAQRVLKFRTRKHRETDCSPC